MRDPEGGTNNKGLQKIAAGPCCDWLPILDDLRTFLVAAPADSVDKLQALVPETGSDIKTSGP